MKLAPISRVTRSHASAQANYDRLSRWYDLIEGGWEKSPRRLGLEALKVMPGERALEIGCGTGSSLAELSRQVYAVGLDLSAGMLSRADGRLKKSGRPTPLLQGDALHLPFPSGCFDGVFLAFTLELIDTPEIPLVLGETRRVLLPSGRLAVVSLSKEGGIGFMQEFYEWAHARFPDLVDCRPIYLRQCLEEAGFEVVKYRLISRSGLGIEVAVANPGIKIPP